MPIDVVDLRSFYAAPLGRIAHRSIARIIRAWWSDTSGMAVAGLGYATPYLSPFRDEAVRVLAFMPAEQGIVHWPGGGISSTALVESTALPLPDSSVDRILLVHILEPTEHPREVLAEVWRVLTPGGRMIAVATNRRGWWARVDTTPFGYGQPFSKRQLGGLLRETLFSPERFAEVLYVPPLERRSLLRLAAAFERFGERLGLPGAGIHLVEASKQLYRPVLLRKAMPRSIARLEPVLTPVAGRTAREPDVV
jgi:SAM-dependent methyltransferase